MKLTLPNKILYSTLLGNILEYFDFMLFAHFNSILAPIFFPEAEPLAASIMTLGLFTVSFITRPVGAILFGKLGDGRGRKYSLASTILCVAASTFLIGCMPTYQHIGIYAPIGLIICRCFQGLAIGGEYCNAGIFLMESVPHTKRSLYSSWLSASGSIGSLLALMCVYIVFQFDNEWSWRVPFLLTPIVGYYGFKLRLVTAESPLYLDSHKIKTAPIKINLYHDIIKNYKPFIYIALTAGLIGVLIWMPATYTYYYLTSIKNYTFIEALPLTALGLILHVLLSPLIGKLNDKFGYRSFMIWGAISTILFAYPLFYCLIHDLEIVTQIGFPILSSLFGASVHRFMYRMYPVKTRCTGISMAFMGGSILGGSAPVVGAYLTHTFSNNLAPSYYIIAITLTWCLWHYYVKDSLKKYP